jgi:hypothetical protein
MQSPITAIQGSDLALLVNAQHQRFVPWVQVEPTNIHQFIDELWMAPQLEGFDRVRLEIVLPPNAADRGFADALRPGHRARAPMHGVRRLGMQRGLHDGGNFGARNPGDPARARSVLFQPGRAQSQELLPPQLHGRSRDENSRSDLLAESRGAASWFDLEKPRSSALGRSGAGSRSPR